MVKSPIIGLDTKTYWLTDRQSQCDSDSDSDSDWPIYMEVCYWALLFMTAVILHHLLNVFVQLANKGGFTKRNWERAMCSRYSDWLRAGRQRGWGSSPDSINNCNFSISFSLGARGSLVVKVIWYKPEGRGWGEVNFQIYLILPAALGPGV
jgi:hypothetical protein